MTTNKMDFISKLFVVGITYLSALSITELNPIDIVYLLFVVGCYIRYIYIHKNQTEE